MLADIAVGHHWGADVLFLLAAIAAGLAAILAALVSWPRRVGERPADAPPHRSVIIDRSPVLGWAAVCLLAIAWLIL